MWTTAFALPHTRIQPAIRRQQSRSDARCESDFRESSRSHQQHHDIVPVSSDAREKVTVLQLEEFGFFSGLREFRRAVIILARFDLRF